MWDNCELVLWLHGHFFLPIFILNVFQYSVMWGEREASHTGAAVSALSLITSCFSPCSSQFPDVSAVRPDFSLWMNKPWMILGCTNTTSHNVKSAKSCASPLMVTINKFINNDSSFFAHPSLAFVIKTPVEWKPRNPVFCDGRVCFVRPMCPHTVARRRLTSTQR